MCYSKITTDELRAFDTEAQERLRNHCQFGAFLDFSLAVLHSNNMQQTFEIYKMLRDKPPKDIVAMRVMLNRFRRRGSLRKGEKGEQIPFAKVKEEIHAIAYPPQE